MKLKTMGRKGAEELSAKSRNVQTTGSNEHSNDDYVFLAAKNIGVNIFQQGRTRNNALALVSKVIWFGNDVLQYFESKVPLSEPIVCKEGCHYCCYYQILLTPPEALLIGNYVEKAYTEKHKQHLVKKIAETLERTHDKSVEERAKTRHDTPCIFLADARCSVYDVRPLVCRALHSLDSDECREAFEFNSRLAEISGYSHRYHIFETVKLGLQEACTEMGCQMDTLPIAKAMEKYLTHPSPIEAWIH